MAFKHLDIDNLVKVTENLTMEETESAGMMIAHFAKRFVAESEGPPVLNFTKFVTHGMLIQDFHYDPEFNVQSLKNAEELIFEYSHVMLQNVILYVIYDHHFHKGEKEKIIHVTFRAYNMVKEVDIETFTFDVYESSLPQFKKDVDKTTVNEAKRILEKIFLLKDLQYEILKKLSRLQFTLSQS